MLPKWRLAFNICMNAILFTGKVNIFGYHTFLMLISPNIIFNYRDLKPANILLCESGHAKISDLGLGNTNLI